MVSVPCLLLAAVSQRMQQAGQACCTRLFCTNLADSAHAPGCLQVEGHNLQYCHHVVVRLATAPTSASQAPGRVALPTEVLQVEAGPVGHKYHPLSGLQSRLHQVCFLVLCLRPPLWVQRQLAVGVLVRG